MIAALGTLLAQEPTFAVPANVAFAILAVIMIAAAIRVVTTRNVVHAALWLIVVLGGNGIIYLLLQAEFVAMTQFLVYLGAIVVLFLFGIMLTRAPMGRSEDLDNNQKGLGVLVGVVMFAVIAFAVIRSWEDAKLNFRVYETAAAAAAGSGNGRTQALADSIFGGYLVPFEALSILLLAALIGAIVIARKD